MEAARARWSDPWLHAALAYALYGVTYLGCAAAQLTPERMAPTAGGIPWWAFFVAGAAITLLIPLLIVRRMKWLTRILALGPASKALILLWRQAQRLNAGEGASPLDWLLIAAAILAAVLMTRAGWSTPSRAHAPAG